jgi:hypothetical protein
MKVCIGGIGVLLIVFLGGINKIYDFFISISFISLWWYGQFFQISKRNYSFQIPKIVIFNFFISIFSWWHKRNISIFSFLSSGMAESFQISKKFISNFKNKNISIFSFPYGGMAIFFKFQKQKVFISKTFLFKFVMVS